MADNQSTVRWRLLWGLEGPGLRNGRGRLFDFVGIFGDEVLPGRVLFGGRDGRLALEIVAIGCSEGVRGVEVLRHLVSRDGEHALEHGGNLLLGGIAVARDGHFYFQRSVLSDRDLALDSGCDGYALGTAELEHGLDILAEERGLDGHFVGQVSLYDSRELSEDSAQSEVRVRDFVQVDDAVSDERGLVGLDGDHAVAHVVCARVNAQDY